MKKIDAFRYIVADQLVWWAIKLYPKNSDEKISLIKWIKENWGKNDN